MRVRIRRKARLPPGFPDGSRILAGPGASGNMPASRRSWGAPLAGEATLSGLRARSGQDARALMGPRGLAGGGRNRRAAGAIGRKDAADRSDGTRMCRRAGPNASREPDGRMPIRQAVRGVLLFGHFLLDKQEKVTRAAWMPHGKSHGWQVPPGTIKRSNPDQTTASAVDATRSKQAAFRPQCAARGAPARVGGNAGQERCQRPSSPLW